MKFVFKGLLVVVAFACFSSCTTQYPRYVNANRQKHRIEKSISFSNGKSPSIPKSITVEAKPESEIVNEKFQIENIYADADSTSVHISPKELITHPSAISSTKPFTSSIPKESIEQHDPATGKSPYDKLWLTLFAFMIPLFMNASGKKFSETWFGRLLQRENFLRLLIGFHIFRSLGGYRTAMKVIGGTLPGFAMIPAMVDLSIGIIALVMLIMSTKGGFKQMRAILLTWNTIGWVDFVVALTLFLSHGMMPSIPIFIPVFFVITQVLIYLMLRRKNFDKLH